jgi:hypothetical protein
MLREDVDWPEYLRARLGKMAFEGTREKVGILGELWPS